MRHPTDSEGRGATAAEVLIEKVARALHAYGSPAHRLEEAMELLAKRFGLVGQFFSTPTAIFASFGAAKTRRTVLVRVEPGEVSLEKLTRLDAVLGRVLAGRLGLAAAGREVDAIVAAPPRYGPLLTTLAFALASGASARFFGGGWFDLAAATVVGLIIGLLARLADGRPGANRLFESTAALFASTLAVVAAVLLPPVSPYVVTLAGLIVLLPGLTITVAMNELATRHLVSGSARLAGAVLAFLSIGFGVALGSRLGTLLVGSHPSPVPTPTPLWTEPIALLIAALAFTVLFRAHPRQAGWIFAAGAVALAGGRFGAALLGPQLGAFIGATMVGIGSNLFARTRNRPAAIVQIPGLMLLVPGSLGFRSFAALLAEDTLSGIQAAFTMTLVAVALVTGLLIAHVLVPPRRAL